MENDYARLRRLRLETELAELQLDFERVAEERLRLSRKNGALTAVLDTLRADPRLDEATCLLIEDAMAFDGRDPVDPCEQSSQSDLSSADSNEDPETSA